MPNKPEQRQYYRHPAQFQSQTICFSTYPHGNWVSFRCDKVTDTNILYRFPDGAKILSFLKLKTGVSFSHVQYSLSDLSLGFVNDMDTGERSVTALSFPVFYSRVILPNGY